jgi:hypothetical protein
MPDHRVDNGLVLSGVDLFLVLDLAQVNGICQQVVQAALGERLAAAKVPFVRLPAFGELTALLQFPHHRDQSLVL